METPTKFYLMNGPLYADDLHLRVGEILIKIVEEKLIQPL